MVGSDGLAPGVGRDRAVRMSAWCEWGISCMRVGAGGSALTGIRTRTVPFLRRLPLPVGIPRRMSDCPPPFRRRGLLPRWFRHRVGGKGGRADWILPPASRTTVPVICTLWTRRAFGHQPGRFQPRTRLAATVPMRHSATPITPHGGQPYGIVPIPGLEPGISALRGRRDDPLLHIGIVGAWGGESTPP